MDSFPSSANPANVPSSFPATPIPTRIRESVLKTFGRMFHHRWLLTSLCVLSLVTGYFTARFYGTSLFEARLHLNYAGETKEGFTADQMFLGTMSQATNPDLVKQVIAEVDPQLSGKTFQRNFSISAEPQPNRMLLKLKWNDAETARNLLNAFLAPYQRHLKRSQISTFDREGNPVVPTADKLAKLEAEIAEMRQKKRTDLAERGVSDLQGQIASMKSVIGTAESQLKNSDQKLAGLKSMYVEVVRQLDDVKKRFAQETHRQDEEDAARGYSPGHAQRQMRIRELMAEENLQIELSAKLKAKLLEKKQLEELVKKGEAKPEMVLRLGTEIAVLKAKMDGNQKTSQLYDEIIKLDLAAIPDSAKPSASPSPIFSQMIDKKFQLELEMLAIPAEVEYLRKEMESQQAKLAYLISIEGKFDAIDQKIARREQEHQSVLAQITNLNSELPLVRPFGQAEVSDFPVSSNRPAMLNTIFLSGSAISLLAVFLYELIKGIRLPSDIAKSLRIPVRWIAARLPHAAADYRELCRMMRSGGFLAKTVLQIQPLTQDAGARTKTAQVAGALASAFAKRGEKVLIIDLCETASQNPGLGQALLAPEESIERSIQPGDEPGVSHMIAGSQELTATQLAEPALLACLEKIQTIYSVILLQGHGLLALQEVEALGLAARGPIVVSDGDREVEPAAREALLDLTAANLAPRVLVIV